MTTGAAPFSLNIPSKISTASDVHMLGSDLLVEDCWSTMGKQICPLASKLHQIIKKRIRHLILALLCNFSENTPDFEAEFEAFGMMALMVFLEEHGS